MDSRKKKKVILGDELPEHKVRFRKEKSHRPLQRVSNKIVFDLKSICPDCDVTTFQEVLTQFMASQTKEEAKPFLRLMVEQLNIGNEKANLAKLKEFEKLRKRHWNKTKDDMKLQNDHLIREEAERDVRRARAIFGN